MPKKLVKYVCRDCGSEDVQTDAYAMWNSARGEDVLSSTFDHTFCNSCEGSCKIVEKEIDDILELAEIFAQRRKNRAEQWGIHLFEFLNEILPDIPEAHRDKAEELLRYVNHEPISEQLDD